MIQKRNPIIWLIVFILSFHFTVCGSESNKLFDKHIYPKGDVIKFLEYDPNTHRGLPILRKTNYDAPNVQILQDILRNSFPAQSVKLYYLAQNYLFNTGQITEIEPVYLLLSESKGAYVKKGFYLRKKNRDRVNKSAYYYIDYSKENDDPENYLGSFTQIFPHEMGHILYFILAHEQNNELPASLNIPFSSVITDFRTAFNEGFAIHFENISRGYEPDLHLRKDIIDNAKQKKDKSNRYLEGYLRDFYLPFRLDYYRITPLLWYNNYESIKRMDWVRNDLFKYRPKEANFRNVEKALFYRNSGVKIDSDKLKNYHQILSTEGLIASFFEKLVNSKLANNYGHMEFYREFLIDAPNEFIPDSVFSPLENQYLKIFIIFNKYLNSLTINQSPLIEFIEGYLYEFPDEKGVIMRLFEKVTGYYYNNDTGPEIWLLNKNHRHGRLLFDQFGGNRTNFYAFNLNAADKYDLQSIKELKRNEIDSILKFRNEKIYFHDIEDIIIIPGISDKAKSALKKCIYDKDFIEKNIKELNWYSTYFYGFARLIEKGLFYLILFITFYYLLFYGKNYVVKVLTVKYVIRKIVKLFILIFLGFASVIFSNEPLKIFLIISVLFITVELLLRKRERNRKDAFYTSFFIIVMIMISVW